MQLKIVIMDLSELLTLARAKNLSQVGIHFRRGEAVVTGSGRSQRSVTLGKYGDDTGRVIWNEMIASYPSTWQGQAAGWPAEGRIDESEGSIGWINVKAAGYESDFTIHLNTLE